MKILMVSAEYAPAHLGGSAESVRLTAEGLIARGHHVGVVTPLWAHAPGPLEEVRDGVAVVRFLPPARPAWTWGSELETAGLQFWRAAADAIMEAAEGVDVLHCQDRRMLVPTFWAARRTRRPAILTLRDVGLRCPIASCLVIERPGGEIPEDCGARRLFSTCGPLYRGHYGLADPYTEEPRQIGPRLKLVGRYGLLAYERMIARRFARIAYVSAGLARHYRAVFPGEPRVLHSPVARVPAHACRPAEGRPLVLFVGKPSEGKGYMDFMDATVSLNYHGLNRIPRCVQIGSPPAVHNPWIEALGPMAPAEVEAWRCRASVCVVPSRQADALPRTALEAMAHGVPTVGTEVGGIPEALAAGGWLAPAGNPQALAEAIRSALAHPWDAEQRDKVRQATEERFGVAAVAEAHERCYVEVV